MDSVQSCVLRMYYVQSKPQPPQASFYFTHYLPTSFTIITPREKELEASKLLTGNLTGWTACMTGLKPFNRLRLLIPLPTRRTKVAVRTKSSLPSLPSLAVHTYILFSAVQHTQCYHTCIREDLQAVIMKDISIYKEACAPFSPFHKSH